MSLYLHQGCAAAEGTPPLASVLVLYHLELIPVVGAPRKQQICLMKFSQNLCFP